MLQIVDFNTEEKAKRCFEMLGERGLHYGYTRYWGTIIGYYVCYLTK